MSPLLFVLVADTLQRFIQNARPLIPSLSIVQNQVLQYADDTLIIMDAHVQMMKAVMQILKVYAQITGLNINLSKSKFVALQIPHNLLPVIDQILHCSRVSFPLKYLGLPLSIRRLKKQHFMTLINMVHYRLAGWKGGFLSLAGRKILINSVINAMPMYYMQAFLLPTWVIKSIEKIKRSFLWRGNEECSGGHCLVAWERVCLPKIHGGLGILDLKRQNTSLLLKCVWDLHEKHSSIWTRTVTTLHGLPPFEDSTSLSFFLKDLLTLLPIFSVSYAEGKWRWSPTGLFTVSSTYAILAHPGQCTLTLLWQIKAPEKVRIFFWLLSLNRLPTQQNLLKKNWPCNTSTLR